MNNYKMFERDIYNINYYISNSEYLLLKEKYMNLFNTLFLKLLYYRYYKLYKNLYNIIKKKNNDFINHRIKTCELLNNINGYALDKEQKTSVINDEDNILILAGAGSGKSLTLIGKIRYLIEEKNINENEILCISFTNESAVSLKNNIMKNYNYDIDVFTFHKLSLEIIKYFENDINIAPSNYLEYIVDEILSNDYINCSDFYIKNYLKNNIVTFINLFKSSGYKYEYFNEIILKNNKVKNKVIRKKNLILINIIKYFYLIYENELHSQKMIDFNDMITYSEYLVRKNGINKEYKYILIDEFQDTSFIRFKLIDSVRKCCDSKVVAVGDDFQSIYRFTGCNLDIFLNFEKYFGYTSIISIKNTYRNSNELIKVAGDFIMKNNSQIKKDLSSNKSNKKPIKIFYYNEEKELYKLINYIVKKYGENILVISRNNNDIIPYLSDKLKYEDNYLITSNLKIKYLTAHKSKGLEEENTILINLTNKSLGFPSKITNNKILDLVLSKDDNYPYSEERRLFYVALTRTKNNVFLFVKKNEESIFVKELISNSSRYIEFLDKLL